MLALIKAAKVITRSNHIRNYLQLNDPMALKQLESAILYTEGKQIDIQVLMEELEKAIKEKN